MSWTSGVSFQRNSGMEGTGSEGQKIDGSGAVFLYNSGGAVLF